MPELRGTQTEKNLKEALSKECTACVQYEIYAGQARKDGYKQIMNIFMETANNENEHAHMWLKWLNPDDEIPHTLDNLKSAASEEQYEGESQYPGWAKVAKEEGFDEIARQMEGVGAIELFHMQRFEKLIDNINNNEVFERPEPVLWQCMKCGHLQKTKAAPEKCPVCGNPQADFEIACENY